MILQHGSTAEPYANSRSLHLFKCARLSDNMGILPLPRNSTLLASLSMFSLHLSWRNFFQIPEVGLALWSFFLNFFWEVVQTYFYSMKEAPFSTMLYGWIHCTFGDVLLTLGSFWLVSIVSRNRRWSLKLNRLNFVGFIMIGIIGTVISERINVHLLNSWSYNQSMPVIPWLKVGLTPFLQWIVIPPVAILLVRHHLLLNQEVAKRKEN